MKEVENVYVESLIDEIKRLAENNVVILRVLYRSSEAYYNYKTQIVVIFKAKHTEYHEPDIREIKTLTISAGKYQEYPRYIAEIIADYLSKDYFIEIINVF